MPPLAAPEAWDSFIATLKAKGWVVEPRPTAAGPEQALDYLARYVHRVAIGDHRILSVEKGCVRFHYRDRSDGNLRKTAQLSAETFIRRFLYHVLPNGFHKIRYYGWMAPTKRSSALAAIRAILGATAPPPPPEESPAERILRLTGVDVRRCPACQASALVYLRRLEPSTGPP